MPWKETNSMNEKIKFIAAHLERDVSFSELCERFRISRKTGYKWVARYESDGVEALEEKSRRPFGHPGAISREIVDRILAVRKKHPRWGPKKLVVVLRRQDSRLSLPATSTVGEILKREGLIKPKRRRQRSAPMSEKLRKYQHPNAIWCADFKGHFPVDGKRCHPLTITDGYSRYLLVCEALKKPCFEPTKEAFERAFREYGLPDVIRTDNGSPFSSLAPGGLSKLAVWWIKLGIHPERIEPGKPQQNGRHERMHSTLKAETARPPRNKLQAQRIAFTKFKREYNFERPHEALEQEVPASRYRPSLKPFPKKVPEIEYAPGLRVERAYPNGVISIGRSQWYISGCLANEYIGLERISDSAWKVFFGPVPLGVIDERSAIERKRRSFGTMIRL